VTFAIAGEKVACNDGIGWDGENYYTSMQHFISMIKHHGYDQYAIRRIMPWGLVDCYSALTGIEVTTSVAIAAGIIFNLIALILSVIFYFRISNLKRWKITTELLGFAILFYTYPVLKMLGYYPVFTDIFAMTLGIMACYYFFWDSWELQYGLRLLCVHLRWRSSREKNYSLLDRRIVRLINRYLIYYFSLPQVCRLFFFCMERWSIMVM